jgi:hypothetical protein
VALLDLSYLLFACFGYGMRLVFNGFWMILESRP